MTDQDTRFELLTKCPFTAEQRARYGRCLPVLMSGKCCDTCPLRPPADSVDSDSIQVNAEGRLLCQCPDCGKEFIGPRAEDTSRAVARKAALSHLEVLLESTPKEKQSELRKVIDDAVLAARWEIDDTFLGFINNYVDLSRILDRHTIRFPAGITTTGIRPKDRVWTVYDVGCGYGFQHVLFRCADRYIGIDSHFPVGIPTPLLPNASFVQGRFAEIVGDLQIDPQRSFGIANMSLAYFGGKDDLEAFDKAFIHKFMI